MRPLSRLPRPSATRIALATLLALTLLPRTGRAQRAVEARVTAGVHAMRRLTQLPSEVPTEFTGNATAVEAFVFLPRLHSGFEFQHAGGEGPAGAGRFRATTLTALVGTRALALEAGMGRRSAFSERSDRDLDADYGYFRLGGRAVAPLGSRGFTVGIRGSAYAPVDGDTRDGVTGLDAATELRWTAPTLPFTAALGYRAERFRVQRSAHYEFTAVSLSAGWAFHRGR